jgi:hypothetical protein
MESQIIASDFQKQGNTNQCMNCAKSRPVIYMDYHCGEHNQTVQYDLICDKHEHNRNSATQEQP